MQHHEAVQTSDFTFKSFFVPFTTAKAITWIVIIGFIVYGNMLLNGFVWDDKAYILFNPDVQTFNPTELNSLQGVSPGME